MTKKHKQDKTQAKLDKAVKAMMDMPAPTQHKRPPEPTRKDLNRKFVMRFKRNGKPYIKEV